MEGKKKTIGLGIGGGSLLAILYSIDPTGFVEIAGHALGHEYVQWSLAFGFAAFVYRQAQKKDMAELTKAVRELGEALRADLGALGVRVIKIENEQAKMNSRMDTLEQKQKE